MHRRWEPLIHNHRLNFSHTVYKGYICRQCEEELRGSLSIVELIYDPVGRLSK